MSTPETKRKTFLLSKWLWLCVLLTVLVCTVGLRMLSDGQTDAPEAAEQTPAPTAVPAPTPRPTFPPEPSPEPPPMLPAVDVDSWQLRLVDFDHPLGKKFKPESLTKVGNGERMDSRVAPYIKELIADAKADGYTVWVCSGFRSYKTQYTIYWDHIYRYKMQGMTEEEAHAATRLEVNYPGCSEHQSGLCADILEYKDQPMEPYIGGSGLMLWLEEHCAEYGFVVRYPDGKTDITGVEYEPWHLRYVGKKAAAYMMANDLCLEEFLALYPDNSRPPTK